jgi:AAA domain
VNLQPPATIVMGPTGSGKTDSIATLLVAGLEVFVIITEPDGIVSLIDSCIRRDLPLDKLHWSYCPPAIMGTSAMRDMITTISSMGFQQVQDIKNGIAKGNDTRAAALKILNLVSNFRCERTGMDFGPINRWEPDRALVIDSLSGLSMIAWMVTLGVKPTAHQGEWSVAQNCIEQLLLQITSDRNFFFVLTSHVEREVNELTGVTQTMVSTLGRKLAPKIPRFFSEVVMAKRTLIGTNQAKFQWSTLEAQADLKNRSLPMSPDLDPSFVPIVKAYHKRKAFVEQSLDLVGVSPPPTEPVTPAANVTPIQTAPMRPKGA